MLDLALDLERDDGAEQRDALDERGKDQRGRLDLAGSFRLARHTLDGLAADAADADAGSDDGEAATETRADGHQAARAGADFRRRLQQGKNAVDHGSISNRASSESSAPAAFAHRRPSPRPGSQRTSPTTRPGTWRMEGEAHAPRLPYINARLL